MDNESTNNPQNADSDDNEPRTMSLMGGIASDAPEVFEDQTPLSSSNKLFNQSTLIVALVAAVAGVTIYLMHMSVSTASRVDSSTQQNEKKVEQWLGQQNRPGKNGSSGTGNLSDLFANTSTIIKMFTSDYSGEQVPIKYVKKNPFKLVTDNTGKQNSNAAERLSEQKLKSEVKKLQLQSIMGGAEPVAVINGELKRVGDTAGEFKIISIGELSVKLQAQGKTFELRMDNGQSNNG